MKIALYTAIYGGKDNIIKVPKIKGVDNILFTDSHIKDTHGWEVRNVKGENKSNNLNAKQFKILPHKFLSEYNLTIWVDGNVEFKDIASFIEEFKSNNMTVFDHNHSEDKRCCIYDEANAIIKLNKDDIEVVNKQIQKYSELDYPKKNGLICGGILLRQNNEIVNDLMDKWWDEIINGSVRDQLSFNFVAWKENFKPHYIKMDIRNNKFFKIIKRHKV